MEKREHRAHAPERAPWSPDLEELEERLEAQMLEGQPAEAYFCIWFACPDVCPPDGASGI